MQCPLSGCCFFEPRIIFLILAMLNLALGGLSAVRPDKSIAFYQWLMKHFNWRAEPIDVAMELRNTRRFGWYLSGLGLALAVITVLKY